MGKAATAENYPTLNFTNKIQNILNRLKKEKINLQIDNISKYIRQILYHHGSMVLVKAHKLEKNYPMRTIVSAIGISTYEIFKHHVEIIKFEIPHHLYTKQKNGKSNQLKSKYLTIL